MKKARKYHPLGPFLVNDLIGETRKNMRYSKRELAWILIILIALLSNISSQRLRLFELHDILSK